MNYIELYIVNVWCIVVSGRTKQCFILTFALLYEI